MSRAIYFVLCVAACSCGTAQHVIQEDTLAIVASVNQVLYRGIENRLFLVGSQAAQTDYFLRSNGCELRRSAAGWIAQPYEHNSTVVVQFCKQVGADTLLLSTTDFHVFSLPTPYPYVAGRSYHDGTISTEHAKAAGGVAVYFDNFILDEHPRLASGVLQIISARDTVDILLLGAPFSAEVKSALAKVKSGDILRFERLIATCGTVQIPLPPLVLRCAE